MKKLFISLLALLLLCTLVGCKSNQVSEGEQEVSKEEEKEPEEPAKNTVTIFESASEDGAMTFKITGDESTDGTLYKNQKLYVNEQEITEYESDDFTNFYVETVNGDKLLVCQKQNQRVYNYSMYIFDSNGNLVFTLPKDEEGVIELGELKYSEFMFNDEGFIMVTMPDLTDASNLDGVNEYVYVYKINSDGSVSYDHYYVN